MSLEVKVEVFHKERITPSSPTPDHLRNFSISILDQFSPSVYIPLILFYPNNSEIHEVSDIDSQCLVIERTKLLKRSLSETLTRFYPFAGRIHDHASVCCNDKGAMFLEAHVNCPMSRALDQPDLGFVKEFMPNLQSAAGDPGHQDLLLVQDNFFECGGIAIGFNISHKISDAFTVCAFLNSWSATSRGLPLPPHQYVGAASRFPPLRLFKQQIPFVKIIDERCTTRRFLFESSKIESLKSNAASAAVQNPTRVETVSALIWKIALKASSANKHSVRSSSTWLQLVNMRNILAQPAAENLMGNLFGFFAARSRREGERDDDLQSLVAAMRKGYQDLKLKFGTTGIGVDDVSRHLKECGEFLQKNDIECYCSTSWCRLPFHETNFGWGKPLMSSHAMTEIKNLTKLMDTSDGRGIEVRLTLKEEDMALFEKNEELLAYASINPSVV